MMRNLTSYILLQKFSFVSFYSTNFLVLFIIPNSKLQVVKQWTQCDCAVRWTQAVSRRKVALFMRQKGSAIILNISP